MIYKICLYIYDIRYISIGDSHMRTFFNSVVKYSCGVPDAAQKGHHTSQVSI